MEPIERAPGSVGEAQAASWLAERLRAAGADAAIEPATYRPGYARLIGALCAAGVGAGIATLGAERFKRLSPGQVRGGAALVAAVATALIADDISNGPRVGRRLSTRRATQNVVAQVGERSAQQTLVVLAHHDAAPTGFIFDQTAQRWLHRRLPRLIAAIDTAPPMWLGVVLGPLLVTIGSICRRTSATVAGTALSTLATITMVDIARDRIVPGANDNLSACAALVAIAERLAAEPIDGLRVLLVSCGAEEVCQGGIYDFCSDHSDDLPPEGTSVINLDTIGSPLLCMLEGEGALLMEHYPQHFRDFVAATAAQAGIPLRRGMRASSSTDAIVVRRRGYPVTTLVSVTEAKTLANYHLMSDSGENLDYGTIEQAVDVVLAVARRIGSEMR